MVRKRGAAGRTAGSRLITAERVWAQTVFALGKLQKGRLSPAGAAGPFLNAKGKLKPQTARVLTDEFQRYGLKLGGRSFSSPANLSDLAGEVTKGLESADVLVFTAKRAGAMAAPGAHPHRTDAEIWGALTGLLSPADPDSVKATDLLTDYVVGGPGVIDAWFADLCRHSIFGQDGLYITSKSVKGKKTIEKIADAIAKWYA